MARKETQIINYFLNSVHIIITPGFLSFFFWPHLMACTIIVPQSGIEPGTSAVSAQSPKGGFLTTEPPGTSHHDFFKIKVNTIV